jgi:hypothetical protein
MVDDVTVALRGVRNKNYKMLGKIWFTARTPFMIFAGEEITRNDVCVGIILMNNGYEDKAYISVGDGKNEVDDERFILAFGTPFPVDAAKLMILPKKAEGEKNAKDDSD